MAFQGFATDARDAKRISDVNELLTKISIRTSI
jgi:hypothetical protein